jgi:hypothetical protein
MGEGRKLPNDPSNIYATFRNIIKVFDQRAVSWLRRRAPGRSGVDLLSRHEDLGLLVHP